MAVSLGPTSKYLGLPEKMYRKCRYVWSASSAISSRTKLREQPGWTTSRWCRKRRSIPSHEVLASRYLRAGRVCSGGAWRGRGLGAGCLGNWCGTAFPGLVSVALFQPGRTAIFFAPPAATCGAIAHRFSAVVLPLALIPLVLGRVRRERWPAVGLFAVLPIGALFLSASRGGIVSFGAELGVLALVMILRRTMAKQWFAGVAVLLVALLLVSWLGVGQILQRLSTVQLLEVSAGKRASMRGDTWRIFLEHPFVGTGLGTLQIVYPPYETLYDGKIVNHAHNDYLEALAETGLLGGLCCAWFIGV